jgi:hypothetical protein
MVHFLNTKMHLRKSFQCLKRQRRGFLRQLCLGWRIIDDNPSCSQSAQWRSMTHQFAATIAAGIHARIRRMEDKSSLSRFWLPGAFGSLAAAPTAPGWAYTTCGQASFKRRALLPAPTP